MDDYTASKIDRIRTELRTVRRVHATAPASIMALLRTLGDDVVAARHDGMSYPQIARIVAAHLGPDTHFTRDQLTRAIAKFCQAARKRPASSPAAQPSKPAENSSPIAPVIPLRRRTVNAFSVASARPRIEENV